MSNQLDFCPYYGKTCECDEDEREVCDLFTKYKDTMSTLLDTRAIKPEKYEELREQDFDTWLTTILHDIIEQVNFDADEVDNLGGAVWNGEFPDGTPYPRQCAREDAYIQCIRQSNQLDMLRRNTDISLNELNERLKRLEHILPDFRHIGSDFCGNCTHSKTTDGICTCKLNKGITDPDDSSCPWFEPPFSASNQLDKELLGKPDREECKHCPKSQCDNCMNFPF